MNRLLRRISLALHKTPPSKQLFADISDYQGNFNAEKYKKSGHVIVAIKAGGGLGTEAGGSTHNHRAEKAHNHKLSVVHYWFARPEEDKPQAQAEAFWNSVKNVFDKNHDYLAIDLEVGNAKTTGKFYREFHNRLLAISGHDAVLYTYISYLNEGGDTFKTDSGEHRVWVADYDGKYAFPKLPSWTTTWAKQYTDSQKFAGIGKCDGDFLKENVVEHIQNGWK